MKKLVCPECGKESTISEWNKRTNRFYSPFYPVENPDEMQIDVISESDFDEYGLCTTKGDVNSANVTVYVCPKCEAEIHSYNLKMVDVAEEDDNSSYLVCKKCGSHNLYFAVDTFAKFKVNPDGSIGEVILNKDGIDCIYRGRIMEYCKEI